jgi:hypothetical protein
VSSSHTQKARIALDGKPPTEAPLIQEVTPGRHTVIISADGYFDEQREVVAIEGNLVAIDAPLRSRPATLAISGPAGAEVLIDDQRAGVLPLRAIEPAGRHFVSVGQNGRKSWSSELELGRGETREVRVGLAPTAQRRAAFALLGVSAAGIVTSGVFAGFSLRQQSIALDIEDEMRTHNIDAARAEEHDRALERRDDWRRAAFVSLGISAGIAATGLVLYLVDPPQIAPSPIERERQRPRATPDSLDLSFAPIVGPQFAGLSAIGRM